jgi:hypothetical protein
MVYLRRRNNWRYHTFRVSLTVVLNSTFASSAPSGALRSIAETLRAGTEVSILVISMYLVGYILGPIVFAPVQSPQSFTNSVLGALRPT